MGIKLPARLTRSARISLIWAAIKFNMTYLAMGRRDGIMEGLNKSLHLHSAHQTLATETPDHLPDEMNDPAGCRDTELHRS